MRHIRWSQGVALAGVLLAAGVSAHANIIISVSPGVSLAGNAAAMAAIDRAASAWESLLLDNITVNINADFGTLGANVLGSTSTLSETISYGALRTAMIADESGQSKQAITDALPANLGVTLPSASYNYTGFASVTTANLKALGLAVSNPNLDGVLTFSNTFTFDFDNSNGVVGTDFESVVLHEIGHVLGFVSAVDLVDLLPSGNINVLPIDLFRFSTSAAPGSLTDFSTFTRDLTPGTAAVFADSFVSYAMSTGSLAHGGDAHQASHWKADEITGLNIGLMDPTLAGGAIQGIKYADLYAMDLIGYNAAAVPEPGTFALMAGAALLLLARRFRRRG